MKSELHAKIRKVCLFTVILSLLLSLLLLSGCAAKKAESEQPQTDIETETDAAVQPELAAEPTADPAEQAAEELLEDALDEPVYAPSDEAVPDGSEFAVEEQMGGEIVTPYITLLCPEEWQDRVQVTQHTQNEEHRITFRTNISDVEVELFTLIISSSEIAEGFPFGRLNDMSGVKYVFAAMNEQGPDSTWTQSEYAEFCYMQERVNDFIMQFHEDVRFDNVR